jgi:4-amino-4-deoxy-L-arabinose transferase-like glycosyltransferase
MKDKLQKADLAAVTILVVVFGTISIWNLDRFPPLQEDEPWILSPGYKFFSQGIFGSDLFTGYYGMERHYLEFMPLMSLLQGAAARLFGLGVFQMRVVPVALGMLTLVLTYAVALKLGMSSRLTGLFAALLLLFWPWGAGNDRIMSTGIPLVDVSRIGRYDILVPPLGLAAWWFWLRARSTGRNRDDFLAGLLAGMTGLAHYYGLFWIVALLLPLLLERLFFTHQPVFRSMGQIVAGASVPWLIWIFIIASNWDDYKGQLILSRGTFKPLSLSFYVENILNERHRYALGVGETETMIHPGFWLIALGVPAALVWLWRRAVRLRDRQALWLLVSCLMFPFLFALLVKIKRLSYLVTVAPLFAILVAALLARLFEARRGAYRTVVVLIIGLTVFQGAWAIVRMQRTANQAVAPRQIFSELRQVVPSSARVLGRETYWLALADRQYRSFYLPLLLSDPERHGNPIPFAEAMKLNAPDFVLLDATTMQNLLDRSRPMMSAYHDEFWAYMKQHKARLIREIPENGGMPIQVYQLDR